MTKVLKTNHELFEEFKTYPKVVMD